jgi:hypothetical protein
MLDGRIDTQGTVQDLRARGVLDTIKDDLKHEPIAGAAQVEEKNGNAEAKLAPSDQPITKLVEDEEQAKGDVEVWVQSIPFLTSLTLPNSVAHLQNVSRSVGLHNMGCCRDSHSFHRGIHRHLIRFVLYLTVRLDLYPGTKVVD